MSTSSSGSRLPTTARSTSSRTSPESRWTCARSTRGAPGRRRRARARGAGSRGRGGPRVGAGRVGRSPRSRRPGRSGLRPCSRATCGAWRGAALPRGCGGAGAGGGGSRRSPRPRGRRRARGVRVTQDARPGLRRLWPRSGLGRGYARRSAERASSMPTQQRSSAYTRTASPTRPGANAMTPDQREGCEGTSLERREVFASRGPRLGRIAAIFSEAARQRDGDRRAR